MKKANQKQRTQKISVCKMGYDIRNDHISPLKWMSGVTLKDNNRNDHIRGTFEIASIDYKMWVKMV